MGAVDSQSDCGYTFIDNMMNSIWEALRHECGEVREEDFGLAARECGVEVALRGVPIETSSQALAVFEVLACGIATTAGIGRDIAMQVARDQSGSGWEYIRMVRELPRGSLWAWRHNAEAGAADFAEVGISWPRLCDIERGEATATPAECEAIAVVVDQPLSQVRRVLS